LGFTATLFNNLFGGFDTAVGGVTATNGQQFGNARRSFCIPRSAVLLVSVAAAAGIAAAGVSTAAEI
jgi:hypothetical protein